MVDRDVTECEVIGTETGEYKEDMEDVKYGDGEITGGTRAIS